MIESAEQFARRVALESFGKESDWPALVRLTAERDAKIRSELIDALAANKQLGIECVATPGEPPELERLRAMSVTLWEFISELSAKSANGTTPTRSDEAAQIALRLRSFVGAYEALIPEVVLACMARGERAEASLAVVARSYKEGLEYLGRRLT